MIKLNKIEVKQEKFANNELRIRNLKKEEKNLIEFIYESSDDLISLMFIKEEIKDAELFIKYMPYSRMDREFENDLFLLKYMANFINNLNFKKVYILEPHSKVCSKLIKNSVPIYAVEKFLDKVKEKIAFTEVDKIVFPDKGAEERYKKEETNYILFSKLRDENTTKIKELKMIHGEISNTKKCIIIDDICSTGNTANEVAKILKEKGIEEVYLLTFHTENQALENSVIKEKYVDKIFTTTSIFTKKHKKVEIIDFDLYNLL